MSESAPFFSVVVPTYNRGHLISYTIRSVLAQTFGDLELLVVDDGSTDDTPAVVQVFADARLRYLPVTNRERGAARNHGLRHATGEYVVFLDSDDEFHPDHLETLWRAIRAQPHPPNFVATKYAYRTGKARRPSPASRMKPGWYGVDAFAGGNFLACNFGVRRANPRLRPFEEDRRYAAAEDWLFLMENTQSDKLLLVDAETVTMVEHEGRSMRADNRLLIERLRLAVAWMEERLALTPGQLRRARGRAYWLCAVHACADDRRAEAWGFARRAVAGIRSGEAITLALRLLAGPRLIGRLKTLAWRS
ncbi:glycosyltransferase family A protein [Phenylobacterium sp.]|uniref:glycosyltransferase family 2 protein n=1 Tax=Phenylobacterium sp. TaxID=1871053 RepID=UPI002B5824C7|nr:glycosyltransferase family A protein [Phenylobacterium sp.]HVI30549.1 glycosyltransferase family A protein [Phenylobacterium sp.]